MRTPIAGAALAAALLIATPPLASVRVGKPAPEFRLEDEIGRAHV